jgi:hypothetical protein
VMNTPAAGSMRLAIVGATGMVGAYALQYALDHPAVERVTSIGRRKTGISHPKPIEVLHQDFNDCSALAPVHSGQDAYVAATWAGTIAVLSDAGYRVIAPDQIGFGKSTKPAHYQCTFQQLAGNTHALLASLGISRVTVVGHSTGGMPRGTLRADVP